MSKHAKTLSIMELLKMFSTERKAVKWLEKVMWQNGKVCPHCGGLENIKPYKGKKFTYHHKDCRMAFTVKTNTVMHSSKVLTQKWVVAIYYIITARKGISSVQLAKELGITQKSAWFMLQRIREACKQGDFQLVNVVEVDETYIGGKESNKHASKKLKQGRGTSGKIAVLGMRQRGGKVKAMPIDSTDQLTLQGKVRDNVAVGSTLYTDEHRGYLGLGKVDYKHQSVKHSAKEFVNGILVHTNGIESVWALLKRGFTGIYHNISTKHLHRYIDEYTFRLNEGNCEVATADRMEAMCKAMVNKRIDYKELVR